MPSPQSNNNNYQNGGQPQQNENDALLAKNKNNYSNNNNNGNNTVAKETSNQDFWMVEEQHRHQQQRLCMLLMLFCAFLFVTASLAVWNAHRRAESLRLTLASHRASLALDKLNRHYKIQAKNFAKHGNNKGFVTCESTILLARHCEKHGPLVSDDDGTQHCSYIGYQRSKHLASLFGPRWPKQPAHLFALTPDRHTNWNFREYETLRPLSEQTLVDIEMSDQAHLADQLFGLLQSGEMCNQIAVVSWKHDSLPDLAVDLGCGPANGCPSVYEDDEFDKVWQLTYVFHAHGASSSSSDDSTTIRKGESDYRKKNDNDSNNQDDSNNGNNNDNQDEIDSDSDDAVGTPGPSKPGSMSKYGWNVYATVVNQHFDPLEFSYASGQYSPDDKSSSEIWKRHDEH